MRILHSFPKFALALSLLVWKYQDGSWKITRALSFDHHMAAK